MPKKKECVLADKECTNCGECNLCDLDKNKICDNCCKCIDSDADYKSIDIDEIIEDEDTTIEDEQDKWMYDEPIRIEYEDEPKKPAKKVIIKR